MGNSLHVCTDMTKLMTCSIHTGATDSSNSTPFWVGIKDHVMATRGGSFCEGVNLHVIYYYPIVIASHTFGILLLLSILAVTLPSSPS